jgi:uncharacterized membrane protein YfhO
MKSRFLTLLLPGLCLLVVGGLIFRDFLFGAAALLYRDIGSDSIILFYAEFVHLSNYIRSQGFPSWSFYVGMGQDLAYATGYLIWQPVSWLPSSWIARALVFQHLAKVLVAGLFFFRFLQLRRLEAPAPLLGALLLSFSGYMSIASSWYPFADDVVCFAAILLGTELAVQQGRWLLLALAVALAGMITPFHLYLCAVFLGSYLLLRLFGQYGWQPRIILRTCFRLAAVTALGVGLGAIVTLPYLHAILNSPRGSGTTSAVGTLSSFPLFGFESSLHYLTAALRPFGTDMLGTGSEFRGWQNYLEAPLTYCGLLSLLLLPQALIGGTRRHRIIFTLFLLGMPSFTLFPWFRYLFYLFEGDYYRTYALFWVLGAISLSAVALSRYLRGQAINLWLLSATVVALLVILYLPFEQWRALINPALRLSVTLFLLSYAALLTIGQFWQKQKLAVWLVVGLSAFELVQFDRITVSQRDTVKKEELPLFAGNQDEAMEALREITARDHEKFFRITKLRPSGSNVLFTLNDAMRYGYYGTSGYRSFNNVNCTNFLTALNIIPSYSEKDTRSAIGLLNSPMLSLFACEKYVLVDDPAAYQGAEAYEFLKHTETGYLFRNTQFLPLGLAFDRYITEAAFLKLPAAEKPKVLLQAVVLATESEGVKAGLTQRNAADPRQETKGFSLAEAVAARRKTALKLTSFSQTRIKGEVSLDQPGILVVPTPFDRGWQALQDGQAVPVFKVDIGLLGVGVEAGQHQVELHYRNILLIPALVVTLASLLLLGAGLWRWPRLSLPA